MSSTARQEELDLLGALLAISKEQTILLEKLIAERSCRMEKRSREDSAEIVCEHDFRDMTPCGPRDNGERFVKCIKCGRYE